VTVCLEFVGTRDTVGAMSKNQLLLWASVGAVVGLAVGAINENIPVWMLFGVALGIGMGYLSARFDPETRD
jgi:hypothetical protein